MLLKRLVRSFNIDIYRFSNIVNWCWVNVGVHKFGGSVGYLLYIVEILFICLLLLVNIFS